MAVGWQRECEGPREYDEAWTKDFLELSADFDTRMNVVAEASGVLYGAEPLDFGMTCMSCPVPWCMFWPPCVM